jgi:F-box-like
MASTTGREQLPNELLIQVFRLLPSFQDVANVSLGSRHFYEILQPDLYFTFSQTQQKAIPNLLRTVISKPYLATYFKHFHVKILRDFKLTDVDLSFLSDEDRAWIREQLKKSSYDEVYCNKWYDRIVNWWDDWDPIVGLLILLCSANLESIQLHEAYDPTLYTNYVRDVIQLPETQQEGEFENPNVFFPKLRRVLFPTTLHNETIDTELLWSCLKNEHITQIHIEGLVGASYKDFMLLLQGMKDTTFAATSRFATTDLSIRHCGLSNSVRSKFLSFPISRTFRISP